MPRSRVCDIESLITLSPNAVIFLFRFLVGACTLQVKGAEMLGNRVLWGIIPFADSNTPIFRISQEL